MPGEERVELSHALTCRRRDLHRRVGSTGVVQQEIDDALPPAVIAALGGYAPAEEQRHQVVRSLLGPVFEDRRLGRLLARHASDGHTVHRQLLTCFLLPGHEARQKSRIDAPG